MEAGSKEYDCSYNAMAAMSTSLPNLHSRLFYQVQVLTRKNTSTTMQVYNTSILSSSCIQRDYIARQLTENLNVYRYSTLVFNDPQMSERRSKRDQHKTKNRGEPSSPDYNQGQSLGPNVPVFKYLLLSLSCMCTGAKNHIMTKGPNSSLFPHRTTQQPPNDLT
eukprot:scaffold5908_cov152-Skeletonema_marinoi.AAC.9